MTTQDSVPVPSEMEPFTPRHPIALKTWRDLKKKKPSRWNNAQGRIWSDGEGMLSI